MIRRPIFISNNLSYFFQKAFVLAVLLIFTGPAYSSIHLPTNEFAVNKFNVSSMTIQSQIYFVNGCFYRVRATLTFEWDGIPGHAPTSASVTNVQLLQECPSGITTYNARIGVFNYDNAENSTTDLSFEPLNDTDLDLALSHVDIINDIKTEIETKIIDVVGN